MAPELEEKSNSRYILLCAGILCMLGDIKYDKEEKKNEIKQDNIQIESKQIPSEEKNETTNESKIMTNVLNNTVDLELSKRTCNPYEYPEDF